MDIREILKRCDHTLLRTDAKREEIRVLCAEAENYSCASVCIAPTHVEYAKQLLGDKVAVCTVVGFPNGYSTGGVKAIEAREAIEKGAKEIDMVINVGMVKDERWDEVKADIVLVREATRGYILKVIIECALLTEDEKRRMCKIVSETGADYIKTSTGFSTGGATLADISLMRTECAPEVKVKAAGGIKSLDDAEAFIALGADRLGTSRIVKLAQNMGAEIGEGTY